MRKVTLSALGLALAGAAGASAPQAQQAAPQFAFPVACTIGTSCEIQNYFDRIPGPGVGDYHCGHETYEGHDGVDIRVLDMAAQRRGVDVLAAAPGKVLRIRDGVQDISVRVVGVAAVQAEGCGNAVVVDHGGGWVTGYCHLAKGSLKVKVGDLVKTGQPLAHVGLSGLTEFPHLHFSVVKGNTRVDPFGPAPSPAGTCKPQQSLWTPAAQKAMAYKTGVVLNAGFAGQGVTVDAVDAGGVAPPTPASPYVTAYVRVLNLQAGDVSQLVIKAPDGSELVSQKLAPLAKDRAVEFLMVGKKRPPQGWARGVYTATYRAYRQGKVAVAKDLTIRL